VEVIPIQLMVVNNSCWWILDLCWLVMDHWKVCCAKLIKAIGRIFQSKFCQGNLPDKLLIKFRILCKSVTKKKQLPNNLLNLYKQSVKCYSKWQLVNLLCASILIQLVNESDTISSSTSLSMDSLRLTKNV
jgi:hypothetical protein